MSKYAFFGAYFCVFRLNKEKYGLSVRIQSKCGKIQTRKTPIWALFTQCICIMFINCGYINFFISVCVNDQNSAFKRYCILAHPHKLFLSRYMIWKDNWFFIFNFMNSLLIFQYLCARLLTPPFITFLINWDKSISEII